MAILELALLLSSRESGETSVTTPVCKHCFSSCKGLCMHSAVWVMPAAGTADPHLSFKGGQFIASGTGISSFWEKLLLLPLVNPISLSSLPQLKQCFCQISMQSNISPFPFYVLAVSAVLFSKSRLTAPTTYSFLFLIFLDKIYFQA